MKSAEHAHDTLREFADGVVCWPNQKVFKLVIHEDHIGLFQGSIRTARAHRDAYIGCGQTRRVVHGRHVDCDRIRRLLQIDAAIGFTTGVSQLEREAGVVRAEAVGFRSIRELASGDERR